MMHLTGDVPPPPSTVRLIAGLMVIMNLSNLNLILSMILLLVFVICGSFAFALSTYVSALVDYLLHFFQSQLWSLWPPIGD
ncbi:BCCT family transporter [Shimia sp. R11_0]|nr:BCCT family transporter [Shimia sp. R11_0]